MTGVFDIQEKRRTGIPDEVRPTFTLKAVFKGEVYSRAIALWGGEAKETPAFEKVRRALREIGANVSRNP
jgi:hypothetical protein